MSESGAFNIPTISDEDVAWACEILGLPCNAFGDSSGIDTRLAVLKSTTSLDVEACPGSGKTTLLVAKLAILSRKWSATSSGICVLSHTNVARREIENTLGSLPVGQRLLTYPHFLGTIHGFVNEFLALPWLRSQGYPIRMIDDEVCQQRRWNRLPYRTRQALEKAGHEPKLLCIRDTDYSVGEVSWAGSSSLGRDTPTYKDIQAVCRVSTEEGFICYDEMFVWAMDLIKKHPQICATLRRRFPLLFIDEVQDNSEAQSEVLHQVFSAGNNPVTRQRFGDSNQAIYQHAGDTDGAETDPFPRTDIRRDIPNSHRFGQEIADLADPLGLVPQDLVGSGPSTRRVTANVSGGHVVFLFCEQTIHQVLVRYAAHLRSLFSPQALGAGIFTAVGAVHRSDRNEVDKLPHSVVHYWPEYESKLSGSEPKPRRFMQYLAAGLQLTIASGEAFQFVEKTAEGIFHLARIVNPLTSIEARRYRHRQLLELLAANPSLKDEYSEFLTQVLSSRCLPDENAWGQRVSATVIAVAEVVGSALVSSEQAIEFLEWGGISGTVSFDQNSEKKTNIFQDTVEGSTVRIRLGSIHSVKGETHTATLVLDTFFRKHHLSVLKPWLLNRKRGKGKEGPGMQYRLKQHYVAMTRPSHLLCLAMRRSVLTPDEIKLMMERGWQIVDCTLSADSA